MSDFEVKYKECLLEIGNVIKTDDISNPDKISIIERLISILNDRKFSHVVDISRKFTTTF